MIRAPAAVLVLMALAAAAFGMASAVARPLLELPPSVAQEGVSKFWRAFHRDVTRHSRMALEREADRYWRSNARIHHDWSATVVPLLWLGEGDDRHDLHGAVLRALWAAQAPLAHASALKARDARDCELFGLLHGRPSPFMSSDTAAYWGLRRATACPLPEPIASRVAPLLIPGDRPMVTGTGRWASLLVLSGGDERARARDLAERGDMIGLTTWERWCLTDAGVHADSALVLLTPRLIALAALDDRGLLQRVVAAGKQAPPTTAECRRDRCDAHTRAAIAAAEVLLGERPREHLHAILRDWYAHATRPRPRQPPI